MDENSAENVGLNFGEMAEHAQRTSTDVLIDCVSSPPTQSELLTPYITFGLAITPHRTITWENDGPGRRIECPAGTVGLIPANFQQRTRTLASADFVIIQMRPERFERVALETLPFKPHDAAIRAREDPVARHIALTLADLAKAEPRFGDALLIDSLASALAVRMLQWGCDRGAQCRPAPSLTHERLQRAIEYIEANLHRVIRLDEIAAAAALSPYHFTRAFGDAVGVTPVRYVWRRRVERAKALLRTRELPLAMVALECGFSGQSHFTTVFKRETGRTPLQYRVDAD